MNQLKHFAFPVPPYSTSPHPDSPGCGRVVQYTHPIGEADDGDRVGIERAVMLHTNLKGQLSAAIDKLHKAREEFNAWAGKGNGADFEHLGGDLAEAAGEVLDLLTKVGY